MSLRGDIHERQLAAMKQRDTATTAVLRMLWAAIRNEEINKQHELSDDEIIPVAGKQVKQLEDALLDFRAGNRADLISQTEFELSVLRGYLPVQLSDEELRGVVARVVSESGPVSAKDMGKLMGVVMKEVKGKADGNRVREMVNSAIQNSGSS